MFLLKYRITYYLYVFRKDLKFNINIILFIRQTLVYVPLITNKYIYTCFTSSTDIRKRLKKTTCTQRCTPRIHLRRAILFVLWVFIHRSGGQRVANVVSGNCFQRQKPR